MDKVIPKVFRKFSYGAREALHHGGLSIPSDIKSLITATSGALKTRRGPSHAFSAAAGQVPDGNGGVQVNTIPPVHSGGYYGGPAYTNLFTGGPTGAETKTLTVQKYCLQCVGGSVAAGAYGTATPSAPLIFTATAGDQAFTPTGCTAWMLSAAGGYVFPVIPHGQSVVSTVGTTTGNGIQVPLTGSVAADALSACFTGGTGTVAVLMKMGVGSAELANSTYNNDVTASNSIYTLASAKGSAGGEYRVYAYDGTTYLNPSASQIGSWSRNEYHMRFMEFEGGKIRLGVQRYTEAGVAIDANIVWSHSTLAGGWTFDGSFNPTTFLRWFLNSTVPNWLRVMMVSNLAGLGDTELLRRITKYGKF